MLQVTLEDAATRLPELVAEATGGEEVVLLRDNSPVAKLVPLPAARHRRQPGSGRGIITHVADDFDATPEGFEEYMPQATSPPKREG
jgi:antitoxin (DNA-binding transcriptional repressor) of toxin-antitoxin stability system